jgi:beta-glucosidase
VSFQLDLSQLAFYDAEMNFVIEPGEIEVFVGRSSADLPASGSLVIPGETRRIATHQVVATRVEIS